MLLSDDARRSLLYSFADRLVTLGDPDTGGWIRDLAEKKSARIDPEIQEMPLRDGEGRESIHESSYRDGQPANGDNR